MRLLFIACTASAVSSQTVCCRSLTASCEACNAGMTIPAFCALNPQTAECPRMSNKARQLLFECGTGQVVTTAPALSVAYDSVDSSLKTLVQQIAENALNVPGNRDLPSTARNYFNTLMWAAGPVALAIAVLAISVPLCITRCCCARKCCPRQSGGTEVEMANLNRYAIVSYALLWIGALVAFICNSVTSGKAMNEARSTICAVDFMVRNSTALVNQSVVVFTALTAQVTALQSDVAFATATTAALSSGLTAAAGSCTSITNAQSASNTILATAQQAGGSVPASFTSATAQLNAARTVACDLSPITNDVNSANSALSSVNTMVAAIDLASTTTDLRDMQRTLVNCHGSHTHTARPPTPFRLPSAH
jgi:hypothetical protein